MKTIPAGRFKQGCLALLDEVERTHEELVITKRGRRVARVVPVQDTRDRDDEILARLRGRGRLLVSEREFLKPTGDLAGWNLHEESD